MRVLEPANSALMVIDIQEKLMPAIAGAERVITNASRLVGTARLMEIPMLATEQYPQGLGATVPDLLGNDIAVHSKTTFDGMRTPEIRQAIPQGKRIVVAGCEAHVCVLQTVLGLLDAGFDVAVVQDATGSRLDENHKAACRRMEEHGAELVTTEMVIFEWLGDARHPAFKDVMKLVK